MRMLLKAVMDTEAANQDAQGVENTTRLVEALKAEGGVLPGRGRAALLPGRLRDGRPGTDPRHL